MYRKGNVPSESRDLPTFVDQEFSRVEEAQFQGRPYFTLDIARSAPAKVWEGMVMIADGTNWNPGSGAGLYYRLGGVWIKAG